MFKTAVKVLSQVRFFFNGPLSTIHNKLLFNMNTITNKICMSLIIRSYNMMYTIACINKKIIMAMLKTKCYLFIDHDSITRNKCLFNSLWIKRILIINPISSQNKIVSYTHAYHLRQRCRQLRPLHAIAANLLSWFSD